MFHYQRKAGIPENSNILFVCKCFPWSYEEGIETQTWNTSRSLIKKGHDVTILCVGTELGCENSHITEGVVITAIPYIFGSYIESISKLAANYFFNLAAKRWINVNDEKFDVVLVQGENGYLFADNETSESLLMKMQG